MAFPIRTLDDYKKFIGIHEEGTNGFDTIFNEFKAFLESQLLMNIPLKQLIMELSMLPIKYQAAVYFVFMTNSIQLTYYFIERIRPIA